MFRTRRSFISALAGLATAAALIAAPGTASAADYVPGQVIVGYAQQPTGAVTANVARATGTETTQVAPVTRPGHAGREAEARRHGDAGVAQTPPPTRRRLRGAELPRPRERLVGAERSRPGEAPGGVGASAVELPARGRRQRPGSMGESDRRSPTGRQGRHDRDSRHRRGVPELQAVHEVAGLRPHEIRRSVRFRQPQQVPGRSRGTRHVRGRAPSPNRRTTATA